MTHTPGPWKYEPLMADGMVVTTGGRFEITTPDYDVCALIHRSGPIRKEDDARLIAAAPELLEACELIALFCEADGEPCDGFRFREGIAKARAAIAKAKGEQP